MTVQVQVTLRRYEPGDLDELHRLIVRTIHTSYPAHYPPRAVEFFINHHAPDRIAADGCSALIVVAFAADRMVGTGTLVGDEITRVFVLPEFQGMGIGKTIMDELETEARRLGLKRLELDASLPAFEFYLARGYRKYSDEAFDVGENQQLRYYRMQMEL